MKELRQWQLQQKSKSILLDGNFIAYVFELRIKYAVMSLLIITVCVR